MADRRVGLNGLSGRQGVRCWWMSAGACFVLTAYVMSPIQPTRSTGWAACLDTDLPGLAPPRSGDGDSRRHRHVAPMSITWRRGGPAGRLESLTEAYTIPTPAWWNWRRCRSRQELIFRQREIEAMNELMNEMLIRQDYAKARRWPTTSRSGWLFRPGQQMRKECHRP